MRDESDNRARLIRIESKLMRGFEELGVNISQDTDWMTVDDAARTVYITTLGRSLTVILSDMARLGATHEGEVYELVMAGELIGNIVFKRLSYSK